MPRDMLQWGLAWQTDQFRDHASRPVTYARGADTVVVQATLGQKLLRLYEVPGGIRMESTGLDFLIPAADLVIAGALIEPEQGDRIFVDEADGATRVYEVLPMGGEPAWRYSEPHRTMIRLHAEYVETEING